MNIYPDWLMMNKTQTVISTGGGYIEIEPGWQLISIPIQYGYWDNILHKHINDNITEANIKNYVLDQIEDILGLSGNTVISVANTYVGDNQFFYNYIPGVTNPNSTHNFKLCYVDGSAKEYSAFWIKSIHTTSFTIKWGEI